MKPGHIVVSVNNGHVFPPTRGMATTASCGGAETPVEGSVDGN